MGPPHGGWVRRAQARRREWPPVQEVGHFTSPSTLGRLGCRAMPELAFFRHGEELLRVALDDRTAIGRDPACDVSLPDPALSRVQAVVERRGDAFHLVDRSGKGT